MEHEVATAPCVNERQSGLVRRSCGVCERMRDDIVERFMILQDPDRAPQRRGREAVAGRPNATSANNAVKSKAPTVVDLGGTEC